MDNQQYPQPVTIMVSREKQWFLIDPTIRVYIDNNIVFPLGKDLPVPVKLYPGTHHFHFQWYFHSTDFVVDIRNDGEVRVKIDRFLGNIEPWIYGYGNMPRMLQSGIRF